MASLGKLVLVTGLAFLLLAAQDHGPAIGVAAARAPEVMVIVSQPVQPSAAAAESKKERPGLPPSGPSNKWNYAANHQKPSSSESHRTDHEASRGLADVGSPS